jgi:pimeloyl-ACP methyl ester carboxylesterase
MSTFRSAIGRLVMLSAAAALLVSACTADADAPGATATTSPSSDPARELVLDGEPMLPCSSAGFDAVCGHLSVPEDRSDPDGRRIELKVVVVPAQDAIPAEDPVFFLAGGPGGAATQSWANAPSVFPEIHAHRDIVLVDQRGTGDSNPLVFEDRPDIDGMSKDEVRDFLTGWADEAFEALDGDARFYTSTVAADDLDDVRAALGYERIDLYGGSYGATLAQYYLRQHEEHVRAVVLDGGTLVDVPILELFAPRSQDALDSVFDRCAAYVSCREAYPNLEAELEAAMTRLSNHPVETDVPDPSGVPVVVDAESLAGQVHNLILSHRSGDVPNLVHRTAEGDLDPLIALILESAREPDPTANAMFLSIMCSEPWATFRPAAVADLGAGSYYTSSMLQSARSNQFACQFVDPGVVLPNDGDPVRSDVPVLLLNGSEDPQDPPANVADAATELPNSLEVVAPGQGHTVGHLGCLPQVVAAFIEAGTVEGLDTACVSELLPPPFDLGTG